MTCKLDFRTGSECKLHDRCDMYHCPRVDVPFREAAQKVKEIEHRAQELEEMEEKIDDLQSDADDLSSKLDDLQSKIDALRGQLEHYVKTGELI